MTSFKITPPIIAHRGASAYAPENTLAAFTKAMQMRVRWIEFDVTFAACGTPIVFHDDVLGRTANGSGLVTEHSYTYLQTLDAGKWFHPEYSGEKILTLAQVLDFLQATGMHANLEVKAPPGKEKELVQAMLPVLHAHRAKMPPILYSSFSVDALVYLRQCLPKVMIGLLVHEWWDSWQQDAQSLSCVSVHVFEELLTAASVQTIKQMQMLALSYTVNDMERAEILFNWGLDAIFTDVPDVALAWWEARKS